MVTQVLTKLLALAADKSGRIAHYEPGEIFDTHILAAMEMEPDDVTTAIRYDAWTAMVMSESVYLLVNAGFPAQGWRRPRRLPSSASQRGALAGRSDRAGGGPASPPKRPGQVADANAGQLARADQIQTSGGDSWRLP
jgi:hypothetical protein